MSFRHLLLLLGCLHLACGEARSGDAKEQEELEGNWSFVQSAEGANQKKDQRPAVKVVFRGDTISFVSEGSQRATKGTYTVDPGKTPKTMDITLDRDGAKSITLAIYELDGDSLRLCHYLGKLASQERPKEFLADKQTVSGFLKREKSARIVSAAPPDDKPWARVTEDDRAIKIETDMLEAVIPKQNPKQWMTGIEKGSFLDKTTGFREVGDGLMVIDWLMEAGSDAAWSDKVIAPDGHGVGRYSWHTNETDPARQSYTLMAHGSSHRKRMVEGPQLCHRMKPVQPEIIRGKDFVAVKTTYQYEYAAPGRKPGSRWTQLIVFPQGKRYFVLMDRIETVNDSDEMFLRNDTPGCVRHEKGDTFSEMYLSYLSGPKGVRIPSSEFFTPFPPDLKFGYRRDTHKTPEHFIRAYHLRDKATGKDGPWLAGLTLEPSVVYEAWCSQRPGGIIVMIEEVHGKPIKAGESFSAAHIVGYFDTLDDMHAVYEQHKGNTRLSADASGWRLGK